MATIQLGEALKQFIKKSKLGNGIKAAAIKDVWEKVMGQTVAKYTTKIEIRQKTLFVQTPIAALKNELHYQKTLIIQRINEVFEDEVIDKVIVE
jgi:hypothetical protein